jgi:hypothetical protein
MFSLHRESLKLILTMNPSLEVVLSQVWRMMTSVFLVVIHLSFYEKIVFHILLVLFSPLFMCYI